MEVIKDNIEGNRDDHLNLTENIEESYQAKKGNRRKSFSDRLELLNGNFVNFFPVLNKSQK